MTKTNHTCDPQINLITPNQWREVRKKHGWSYWMIAKEAGIDVQQCKRAMVRRSPKGIDLEAALKIREAILKLLTFVVPVIQR